jgi:hypothetical protein
MTLNYLRECYDCRLISSHTDHIYPPRSPHLMLLDHFLFPTEKNIIFKQAIHTIDDSKLRIRRECGNLSTEVLSRVSKNLKGRLNMCADPEGQHFQRLF